MIFNPRRLSPIGLDAGSRSIKAVQVEHTRGKSRIVAAAAIPREGAQGALDTAEAERVLGTLWRQGFVGQSLVLAVPPQHVLSGVMELPPRTSGAPLESIARAELARASRSEPDALEIAWWELPGGARAAEGTHVMAIGCRHADADVLLDRFETLGAEVVALEVPATALARACSLRAVPAPGLTAVLDLGWSAAQLLILRAGAPVYERSVKEHGIGALQTALQAALSVEPDLARLVIERIGCDAEPTGGFADWELADRARSFVGSHIDAILAEVVLSLNYAERRFGAVPPSVLLTGGGGLIPGLPQRAAERHSVTAAPVLAADLTDVSPAVQTLCAHAPLVTALGLALHDGPEGRPA